MRIEFPWPPASLSGHIGWKGGKAKADAVKRFRNAAWAITKQHPAPKLVDGDIYVRLTFTPPNNRGDRTNYYNRCKPILDGLADALGVNDKRFVPIMDADSFQKPCKPGCVVVELWQ